MKLEQYIKEQGLSNRELAIRLGVSDAAISLWLSGDRSPKRENISKIIKATCGQVTYEDWYGGLDAA
jgi:transcriptional regulator with XRE-family HTH domain